MKESRLVGLAVAVLGSFALTVLIPYGIASPSEVPSLALAPEFWPVVIASVFTLMGVVLAIAPTDTDEASRFDLSMLRPRAVRLAIILAALFGYYLAVPWFGMVTPAIVLLFGLSWFAGERRLKLLIPISIVVPVVLTGFFLFIANIPIPLGLFEFIYS